LRVRGKALSRPPPLMFAETPPPRRILHLTIHCGRSATRYWGPASNRLQYRAPDDGATSGTEFLAFRIQVAKAHLSEAHLVADDWATQPPAVQHGSVVSDEFKSQSTQEAPSHGL